MYLEEHPNNKGLLILNLSLTKDKYNYFLFRLNYWIKKCGKKVDDQKGLWVYNSINAWAEQLHCSVSTMKRTIKYLEEEKFIFSKKVDSKKGNHTKWYTINYDKLSDLFDEKSVGRQNTQIPYKNKWTIPLAQNEPIIISNNKNNYTNNSSKEERKIFLHEISSLKEMKIKTKELPKEISEEEQELVKIMVKTWDKVFEYSISPIKAYYNKRIRTIC